MNTILLFIWIHIVIISLVCFYYNEKIITTFIEMNTPKQPPTDKSCVYTGINNVNINNLSKYNLVNGIQTYKYIIDNTRYAVSTDPTFYVKACSLLCSSGFTPTGDCVNPSDQEKINNCESLIKPKSDCVSSAKPIFQYTSDKTPDYYYINFPIVN